MALPIRPAPPVTTILPRLKSCISSEIALSSGSKAESSGPRSPRHSCEWFANNDPRPGSLSLFRALRALRHRRASGLGVRRSGSRRRRSCLLALHGYLLLLGGGALAAFLVAGGFFSGSAERRRRIGLMTAALPWGARGSRFAALSAAMQFGFFAITQFGEGCPLCKGDLLVGSIAALVASGIGAFAVAALRRRIVRYFAPAFASRRPRVTATPLCRRRSRPTVKSTYAGFTVTIGSRPPPALLA